MAGYAKRLMLDWYDTLDGDVKILCPASVGNEGKRAPDMPFGFSVLSMGWCKGQCTFLTNDRCELHATTFKPLQCRAVVCCEQDPPDPENASDQRSNVYYRDLWDTDTGRALVEKWHRVIKEESWS